MGARAGAAAQASEHNPGLPSAIDAVIGKAMAKSAGDRYASCCELVEAGRDALGLRPRVAARTRTARVLAAAGIILVAAAVLAGFLLSRTSGTPARPSAAPTLAPKVDSLQRIDPATNAVVATIGAGAGADGVVAGEGAVFVASTDAQTVSRIDPKSNAVVERVSSAGEARSIALGRTPDGRPELWVSKSHSIADCALEQLDPKTLQTQATGTPGQTACGPVATHGGQTWYGGSWDFLVHIDPYTGEAIKVLSVGSISDPEARGLAVGAGAVWLASPFTKELLRFDESGRRRAIELGSGSFPTDVAVGEGEVWVTDSVKGTVVEIDPSQDRVVRRIRVGHDPIAVAVGRGSIWVVANGQNGTVSRIDPGSGRVTATIEVGPYPRTIAVGERAVWVTVHPT